MTIRVDRYNRDKELREFARECQRQALNYNAVRVQQ